MRLMQRVRRLSARAPRPATTLPGVDAEWQELARANPGALRRAEAVNRRIRLLWPDTVPTVLFDDQECWDHYTWLQSTKHGDLATWFGHLLDEDQVELDSPSKQRGVP